MVPHLNADNGQAEAHGHHGEESQWTRVVRKGKKLARHGQSASHCSSLPLPNPTPQLTPEEIHADHARLCARWRASDSYAHLLDFLRDAGPRRGRVTRAICLGLGSFDPENGSWDAKRRAHTQLDAFLAMVKLLSGPGADRVPCFFQEPCFTGADKAFLESMGHVVVESPRAYAMTSPTTLVFGIHLYKEVWAEALAKCLPAIFVGTSWNVWDECGISSPTGCANDRIREMDSTFDKFRFPQYDVDTFSSTCIYWRKQSSGSESMATGAHRPLAE
ncbi:hypothetical protein NKR23_g11582 [Pleurostoma richardsiae]|uniref:SRR1-like domain-containing protein n=1 Tax=Pleurostoma richardsiae TaxID=41990 RepID=A0AA38RBN5_9PEZI|nr:hypothetical protein NKR23_g11582 [Pleurostoma richardsiae]